MKKKLKISADVYFLVRGMLAASYQNASKDHDITGCDAFSEIKCNWDEVFQDLDIEVIESTPKGEEKWSL